MRNMSFALTTQQILDRTKTVTRRLGWESLKPGDLVCAIEKGHGLKKGEKVKRLAVLRIVRVDYERLWQIPDKDIAREGGFPDWTMEQFVTLLLKALPGCRWTGYTRIEFEYVD